MLLQRLLILTILGSPLVANEVRAQDPVPELTKEDEFWFSNPRRKAAAVAQLVLAQDPITAVVLRNKTLLEMVWGDLEGIGETVPALNPDVLLHIRDRVPLPNFVMNPKPKHEIPKAQVAVYSAYCQALVNSFQYPADLFKKAAQENEHLKFGHLMVSPEVHRGKIVTVQGRLFAVRKHEAPLEAQKEGVKDLYEGFVFGPTKGSNPFVVIFTTLPEGIPISEKMERRVTFHGYFIMRYKYKDAERRDQETPLLIGPTLFPAPRPASPLAEMTFPMAMIIIIGVILAAIVASFFIISWWFRRGDSKIKAKVAELHDRRVTEMMENDPDWQEPAAAQPPDRQM